MSLANARPVPLICTKNRKVAEAFYGDTLGLPRLPGDDFAAVFDMAGIPMRLTEVPDFTPGGHPVLGWEVTDIEGVIDRLGEKGVKMSIYEGLGMDARGIWTAPDGAAKVAFFFDPDGNGLSLTQWV